MRTATFSGLAALAALVLSNGASLAQPKFISIGQGGHARSADHADRAGPAHRGDHRRPVSRVTGFFPFERFDSPAAAAVTAGPRHARQIDGTSDIRAVFEGPLAAGATAAATYILLRHGPRAFGLEDDYRKAMQSLPAVQRKALMRRASAGPKIIRIGE